MLSTDEIRLGLYSSRAFDIIDALIATYWRTSKSYEAKCTFRCMKFETAPNREIILKFDRDKPVHIFQRSVWNKLNTAMEARQQLVKLLKYVVKHTLDGSCFTAREFTVERMGDDARRRRVRRIQDAVRSSRLAPFRESRMREGADRRTPERGRGRP